MKPETADGFELAWASNGALGRQRTALYYNHYNNLISVDCGMNTNDPCLFYNTDGHSKIYQVVTARKTKRAVTATPNRPYPAM